MWHVRVRTLHSNTTQSSIRPRHVAGTCTDRRAAGANARRKGEQLDDRAMAPTQDTVRGRRQSEERARVAHYAAEPFFRIRRNSSSLMKPSLSRSAAVIISPICSSVIDSPSSRATACRSVKDMRP